MDSHRSPLERIVSLRTPGPWRVDTEGNRILATDARETIVCHLGASCRNPEVLADAVLLSVAPELWELAECVAGDCPDYGSLHGRALNIIAKVLEAQANAALSRTRPTE